MSHPTLEPDATLVDVADLVQALNRLYEVLSGEVSPHNPEEVTDGHD
jgi:hypothetical protein